MSISLDQILKQLSSQRRRNIKRSLRRQFSRRSMEPFEVPKHIMKQSEIFLGATDYTDYIFSNLLNERKLQNKSIFMRQAIFLCNKKHFARFIESEFEGDEILQMRDDEGIIIFSNETSFLKYHISSNSATVKFYGDKEFVKNLLYDFAKEFEVSKSYIEWVYSSDGGSVAVPLNMDNLPVKEMYPFLGDESLEDYYDRFMSSNSNILLLIGPPGTGKTTFIRGLLERTSGSAIVTYDPSILEKDYLFAKFIEDDANIMVLEDSDNFLKARSDGNTMMHRFLNVGDGLVTTKGKKMIFSTNLPSVRDIDPALVRPGRCFDVLNFNTLKQDEAQKLAERFDLKLQEQRDSWTVSEVFNKKVSSFEKKKEQNKFGFI